MLTARFVETLKGKPGERLTYRDAQVEGLELRIGSASGKTWSLRYRLPSGERRRLSLGSYPHVSLADARAEAMRAMARALDDDDPAATKKRVRDEAKAALRTIGEIAADYFVSPDNSSKKPKTIAYEKWLWGKHMAPRVAEQRLTEFTRADARLFVREVGSMAGARTGNYAQAVLRQILNYAIREELIEANPAQFEQIFKLTSRDRVLTTAELLALWNALDGAREQRGLGLSEPPAIALQLCLTTLQRAGEVVGIEASEIDWSVSSWIIPAARSKNGRAHFVPLSKLARRLVRRALILASAAPDSGNVDAQPPKAALAYNGPLFPAVDRTKPSERHVLSRAMKRACEKLGVEDATPHDLRRTGASMLASERCGVPGEIIARILNHTPLGSPVTQIYNRYDYAAEKRAALEKWGETIIGIVREAERA